MWLWRSVPVLTVALIMHTLIVHVRLVHARRRLRRRLRRRGGWVRVWSEVGGAAEEGLVVLQEQRIEHRLHKLSCRERGGWWRGEVRCARWPDARRASGGDALGVR
jgi:hypothetical protein